MNYHLSDKYLQALDTCIEKCEEYINMCGELSEKCTPGKHSECLIDTKKCLEKSDECIMACHESIKHAQEHLKECNLDHCKQACQEMIEACNQCIRDFTKLREASDKQLIASISDDVIADCSSVADACNNVIEVNL